MAERYPAGDGRDDRRARGGYAPPYAIPVGLGPGVRVAAGAVGGLWGAIVMGVVAALADWLLGRGPAAAARLAASAVYGTGGAAAGDVPVVVGYALILFAGLALGALFGLVFGGARLNLVLWGIFCAAAVWALVRYVALPALDPAMAAAMPPVLSLLYFILYGAVLGGYVADRQRETGLFYNDRSA